MSQSQNMTHVLIHAIHGLVSHVDVVRNLRISCYAFATSSLPFCGRRRRRRSRTRRHSH